MTRPSISILVPVYKVEPFLSRCICSVLNQTFTDWEMILVDDGSPDNCPAICDEYASKDSRIKVVHKHNGGLISARKSGFEQANADWIMFLDSDDWLPESAIETLYHYTKDDYDIIRGKAMYVDASGEKYPLEAYTFEEGVINNNHEYIKKLFVQDVMPYLWGAIYRRNLFNTEIFDKGINANISFCEDWITNILISPKVNKILYIRDYIYYYFRNQNSIVHSFVVSQTYMSRIDEIVDASGIIEDVGLQNENLLKRAKLIFDLLFIPEFTVEYQDYIKARDVIDYRSLNRKRRLFFKYPKLFWIYAKIYRFIFKYFRLKGKTRSILK